MRHGGIACSLLALLVCVSCSAGEAAAPAPEMRGATSSSGVFHLAYQLSSEPIPINEMFQMRLKVRDADQPGQWIPDAEISVEARMPAHNHGMNVRPVVTQEDDATYTVDGMMFHMPGNWVIMVDIRHDGRQDTVFIDRTL